MVYHFIRLAGLVDKMKAKCVHVPRADHQPLPGTTAYFYFDNEDNIRNYRILVVQLIRQLLKEKRALHVVLRTMRLNFVHNDVFVTATPVTHLSPSIKTTTVVTPGLSYAQAVNGSNKLSHSLIKTPKFVSLPPSSATSHNLEPLQSLLTNLTNEVKNLKAEVTALKTSSDTPVHPIKMDYVNDFLTSFYDSTKEVSQQYVLDNFDVLVSSVVILGKEISALRKDFNDFKESRPFNSNS